MGRQWKSWPHRFAMEANSSSGALGLLSGVGAVAAGTIGLPLLLTAVPALVTGGMISYCLYKSWPEKSLKPEALVGSTITNLSDLRLISPPISHVGFVGPSQVGKTTALSYLSTKHPPANVRTDNPYATVTLAPGQPSKHFALIDAAGQQFVQQFKVAENADLLFIFLDHAAGNDITLINTDRLNQHVDFLEQLRGYVTQQPGKVSKIHFVLNKRDKWEAGPDAETLKIWFEAQVKPWTHAIGISISHSYHSNFVTGDNITLTNILRDRII